MEDDRRPGMQLGNVTLSPQAKADQWEEKNGLFSEYIEKDNTPVLYNQRNDTPGPDNGPQPLVETGTDPSLGMYPQVTG